MLKLTSKITNEQILININRAFFVVNSDDGVGSKINFGSNNSYEVLVIESVEEIFEMINKLNRLNKNKVKKTILNG